MSNTPTTSKRIRTPSLKVRTASPGTTPSKRKKISEKEGTLISPEDLVSETTPVVPATVAPVYDTTTAASSPAVPVPEKDAPEKTFVFKDPNFVHSSKEAAGSKKTRVWKNLKQIVAAEKALPWKPDDVTYSSIEAVPSFKPAKKYSDISGLEAAYRDPETKLRYSTSEEFARIKLMPSDLVAGCLALRKANAPVP